MKQFNLSRAIQQPVPKNKAIFGEGITLHVVKGGHWYVQYAIDAVSAHQSEQLMLFQEYDHPRSIMKQLINKLKDEDIYFCKVYNMKK